MEKKLRLLLLVTVFVYVAAIQAGESDFVDQKQLEWFGVSTLKNVN
jgi:hypothetical protein